MLTAGKQERRDISVSCMFTWEPSHARFAFGFAIAASWHMVVFCRCYTIGRIIRVLAPRHQSIEMRPMYYKITRNGDLALCAHVYKWTQHIELNLGVVPRIQLLIILCFRHGVFIIPTHPV